MKRLTVLATLLGIAGIVVTPASGGGGLIVGGGQVVAGGQAPKPAAKPDPLGRWAPLKEAASLTKEQEQKIADLVKTHNQKQLNSQQADARKHRALQVKLGRAQYTKDGSAKLQKQMADAYANRARLGQEEEAGVLAVLAPKQRLAWERHLLVQRIEYWTKALKPADLQQECIAKLYDKWAIEYVDLKSDDQRFEKDRKVLAEIDRDVLTKAQRAELAKLRETRKNKPPVSPFDPIRPDGTTVIRLGQGQVMVGGIIVQGAAQGAVTITIGGNGAVVDTKVKAANEGDGQAKPDKQDK